MSLARKILYGAGAIALAMVVIGVFLPSTVHVVRETAIDAPAATVFALISDMRRMQEWSPWTRPSAGDEPLFSGPRRGDGASVRFMAPTGQRGRQTVIASDPFRSVVTEIELEGSPAFRSAFTLDIVDGRTKVTWTCDADLGLNLLARYLRPKFRSRIGGDYESGLADLKSMAESLPRADFSDLEIEHTIVEPQTIAYVTTDSMPSATAISEAMGEAFFDVLRFIDRHGLREAGAPLSISRNFSGSRLVFDAGVPVEGIVEPTDESGNGVRLGRSYGGPVIRVAHSGPYGGLAGTHEKVAAYLAAYGIGRNGDAWESYESDPARTPESDLLTYVYYPVTEAPPL
jgi:effector-binding domain-containing protein